MVDKFSLYDTVPFEWLKLRIFSAGPIVDVVVVVVVLVTKARVSNLRFPLLSFCRLCG